MNQLYESYWIFSGNDAKTHTVHEQDEIQLCKLLGPDGQPYAIKRPKMKLGFDLSPKKL